MNDTPPKKRHNDIPNILDITPGTHIEVTGYECDQRIFLVRNVDPAGRSEVTSRSVKVKISNETIIMGVVNLVRSAKNARIVIAAKKYDDTKYTIVATKIVDSGEKWNVADAFGASKKKTGTKEKISKKRELPNDASSVVDTRVHGRVAAGFSPGVLFTNIVKAVAAEIIPVIESEIRAQIDVQRRGRVVSDGVGDVADDIENGVENGVDSVYGIRDNIHDIIINGMVADPQLRSEARQIIESEMRSAAYIDSAKRLKIIAESNGVLLNDTAVAIIRGMFN